MKISVIDLHGMQSITSAEEVKRRVGEVPGIESVIVNLTEGSATICYDETRLEDSDIKLAVRQRGYRFILSLEIVALSILGSSTAVAINALLLKSTKLARINNAKPKTSAAPASLKASA